MSFQYSNDFDTQEIIQDLRFQLAHTKQQLAQLCEEKEEKTNALSKILSNKIDEVEKLKKRLIINDDELFLANEEMQNLSIIIKEKDKIITSLLNSPSATSTPNASTERNGLSDHIYQSSDTLREITERKLQNNTEYSRLIDDFFERQIQRKKFLVSRLTSNKPEYTALSFSFPHHTDTASSQFLSCFKHSVPDYNFADLVSESPLSSGSNADSGPKAIYIQEIFPSVQFSPPISRTCCHNDSPDSPTPRHSNPLEGGKKKGWKSTIRSMMGIPNEGLDERLLNSPSMLTDYWDSKILPHWEVVRNSNTVKQLSLRGYPLLLRGDIWMNVSGNYDGLTHQLFDMLLFRIKIMRQYLMCINSNYLHAIKESRDSILYGEGIISLASFPEKSGSIKSCDCEDIFLSNQSFISPDIHYRDLSQGFLLVEIDIPRTLPRFGICISSGNFHEAQREEQEGKEGDARFEDRAASPINSAERERNEKFFHTMKKRDQSFLCLSVEETHAFRDALRTLLNAYIVHRPDIGYVQGMGCIAAVLLLHQSVFNSFVLFNNIMHNKIIRSFYTFHLPSMHMFYQMFDTLLYKFAPDLWSKLASVPSETYLVDWIFSLYSRALPLNISCRVWDRFFYFGDIVLFQAGLSIILYLKNAIIGSDIFEALPFSVLSCTSNFLLQENEEFDYFEVFDSLHLTTKELEALESQVRKNNIVKNAKQTKAEKEFIKTKILNEIQQSQDALSD